MSDGIITSNQTNFTDTGQWKLIVYISAKGISAILKNAYSQEENSLALFIKKWDVSENELLSEVKSSVYENPRMLDDFATQIIIDTPKSLWIPVEFTDDDEFDEHLFTDIYPSETEDISADFDDMEVCIYTLVPGLNSFLNRTLPGCKISSSLSILKSFFEKEEIERMSLSESTGNMETIYVNLRDEEADIFAFRNGRFLSGAVHEWKALSDIAYKVLLITQSYSLSFNNLTVRIFGDNGRKEDLSEILGDFIPYIDQLDTPSIAADISVPLSVGLIAGKTNTTP